VSETAGRSDYRTRAQVILEDLRDRISTGMLAPGDRLLLKPISQEFGCSEIPVREALRSLQAEGFINVIPHVGAFVAAPNIEELVQLTEVRAILEPEATVAAAPHVDEQLLERLRAMLLQMRDLIGRGDAEEYGRLNRRFHQLILDQAPNKKLVALVKDLWGQADRGRLVYKKGTEFLAESVRQHADIVDAITRKDYTALRELVVDHSQYGLNAVRSLAAEAALEAAVGDKIEGNREGAAIAIDGRGPSAG
jgi:DNA-binding GntR family transcriptional regulator